MRTITAAIIFFHVLFVPPLAGQAWIGGEEAVYMAQSSAPAGPRSNNGGRPSFSAEGFLLLGAEVNARASFISTVAISNLGSMNIEELALRVTGISALDVAIEAGRINLPFGNLAERRFPRRNPLFGLPLIHEYRTAVQDNILTEAQLTANRGHGQGMRLLENGLYDLGAVVSGSIGVLDYAFAVSNGTVSAPSYGTGNANRGFSKILRLAVTPLTGLTLGTAYAWGPYLETDVQPLPHLVDVEQYTQQTAEVDCAFSFGHAVVNGEVVFNVWPVPLESRDERLTAVGYYFEAKYTIMPRWYVAARINGLSFGTMATALGPRAWDSDVTEWEGGIGYFVDNDVLLKVVRRETRTPAGPTPADNLTVLQLVMALNER